MSPPLMLSLFSPLFFVAPVASLPAPLAMLVMTITASAVTLPARLAVAAIAAVPIPITALAVPTLPAALSVFLPVRRPTLLMSLATVLLSVTPVPVRVAAGTGTLDPATALVPTVGAAVLVSTAVSALPVVMTLPWPVAASLPAHGSERGRQRRIFGLEEKRSRVPQPLHECKNERRATPGLAGPPHATFRRASGAM